MTVEHSRAAEPIGLPVRTQQQELKRRRLKEELEPTTADLFAAVGRDYLSAIWPGEGPDPHLRGRGPVNRTPSPLEAATVARAEREDRFVASTTEAVASRGDQTS